MPIVMPAKGSAHSTTPSGVSGGVIEITDSNAQASTGQDIAGLKRDVSTDHDSSGALKPINSSGSTGQLRWKAHS
jgi:filamentous hemagglutinin